MSVWFWLFLIMSAAVGCLCYYVFWLVRYVSDTDEDLKSTSFNLKQFEEHLSSIYEMEMFYGDDTLKSLLSHAKELRESLQGFRVLVDDSESDPDSIPNAEINKE